jgi:hypothetical protein
LKPKLPVPELPREFENPSAGAVDEAEVIPDTGALYSKNSDRAAKVGMTLFSTALGLCGGILHSSASSEDPFYVK